MVYSLPRPAVIYGVCEDWSFFVNVSYIIQTYRQLHLRRPKGTNIEWNLMPIKNYCKFCSDVGMKWHGLLGRDSSKFLWKFGFLESGTTYNTAISMLTWDLIQEIGLNGASCDHIGNCRVASLSVGWRVWPNVILVIGWGIGYQSWFQAFTIILLYS